MRIVLDSGNWENVGNLDGDRMTGLVSWRVTIDGATVRLEGEFLAIRE